MNESDLLDYLSDKDLLRKLPFSEEDFMELGPEPLIVVYQLIFFALTRNCRVLQVTSNEVIMRQEREGSIVYRDKTFPEIMPSRFEAVRQQDKKIQPFLSLVNKSADMVCYQINLPLLD